MLVFKGIINDEFSIYDTDDDTTEQISGEELLNVLCTTNLVIEGLSLSDKGFIIDSNKTILFKPKKVKNSNLNKAKKAKNDEFYTQLSDIEKELSHYPIETFKDKVIYCPCDSVDMSNGYISNFAIYFYNNFKDLGIKKLICTCYSNGINYYEYDGKIELKESRGSGDFRSEYCTKLLQEADIVVTNPPFSLFREFVKWLVDADKKFLIVGNVNAVTYKEIFPLIKDNKLMWGFSTNGSNRYFEVPEYYPLTEKTGKVENGKKYAFVNGVMWYSTITSSKKDKLTGLPMQDLVEKGIEFPRYDNYDAIDVSKVKNIPMDYDGVMGVPITFLNYYNPDQFEIVNANDYRLGDTPEKSTMLIKDKEATITDNTGHTHTSYARICIRKRLLSPGADGWHINGKRKYARIFIKRIL